MTNSFSPRTVIFAGGGTGGHLFPGIAVAEELRRRDASVRVLFLGSEKPIEREILAAAGFEHIALPAVPLSFAPLRIVPSLAGNWRAYRQAQQILSRERPSVVVGLGGFVSVPPVLAARRAHVPIMLLEQNVVPGKATCWLSRFADVVCLPWEEAARGLPAGAKIVVTGNPIRREIASLGSRDAVNSGCDSHDALPPTLLILGGSQGASTMNALVLDALTELREPLANWRIVHQTGAADVNAIRQRYASLALTADVQPFLRDMAEQYRRATCVISRAGATTLAELACAGVPALLVPLPTSAHDHQRLNAKLFVDRGAAILVEQTANNAAHLREEIRRLLTDLTLRDRMREAQSRLARPDAVSDVMRLLTPWLRVPESKERK